MLRCDPILHIEQSTDLHLPLFVSAHASSTRIRSSRSNRGGLFQHPVKDQAKDAAFEAILQRVQEGGDVDRDLRVLYWNDATDLPALLLTQVVTDMEQVTGQKDNKERPYELWRAAFANRPEKMQILSPSRGELFGIEAVNVAVQKHIGQGMLDKVGALDGITLFDKVIQVRNRPKSDLAYAYNPAAGQIEPLEIFNGELGFVKPHGFDGKRWIWSDDFHLEHFQVVFSRKPNLWVNFGRDLGQLDNGRWVPRQPVEENLELAYAISVHKAQGSEFERTYVIVPKHKARLLSPELFYTALTRASRHCTLLVEQDVGALLSMRRREKAQLLQINSSLFTFRPAPAPLLDLPSWYEEGKVHESLAGCMVRSKSEVIIANLLAAAKIPFRYEVPLFAPDGTFRLPDFTIEWRGRSYYWEHLGLLDRPKYKSDWRKKKSWYAKHFLADALLITQEARNLSKIAQALIYKTFI